MILHFMLCKYQDDHNIDKVFQLVLKVLWQEVVLGGLGVTCLPRDLRFAGSHPTEVDGAFHDIKILSTSPSEVTLRWEVPSLRFQARYRTSSLKK